MKKNVLIVEYDTVTIELIQDILSSPIFNVEFADEGEKAKELVKKKVFDLVITAAMLPKFHGFNLSQFIANQSPQTKIIIISGIYKGIEYKHQAMTQYKADDFLEKPLNKDQFKLRIFELLSIEEADIKEGDQSPSTRVPLTDTTKIPAIKKSESEKVKFSSNDLFGDIIEEVEKIPSHEIHVEKSNHEEADAQTEKKIELKPKANKGDQQIDLELANLVKVKKEKPDVQKFKKIEDDISKKLEDTLSGLGISAKEVAKKEIKGKKIKTIQEPLKEKTALKTPVEKTDELGDYDILGLIARGGMAEIYKAKKKGVKGFEKVIAIKKILSGYGEDDKYIEMFVDEAKIAAELTHPNIVQIYDLGKKDDFYFIAMEYIQGKDLRLILKKLIQNDDWIPETISVYLIIKVLEALSYAHSAKDNQGRNLEIVHRDISPPNIMLSFNGDVKLTDFGVSKASIKIHQTISGALKGKLLYMSPEQAKGDKNIDNRSDLFSVGVLLFELITQKKLFLDSSEMEVLKKVQNGSIIKPSKIMDDIDTELERILLKALKKDRDLRYQSAAEMIHDLESYLRNQYDHTPNAIHVSHFLYDLFKSEIKKENIKVNLKPIPFEIKRKAKQELPEEDKTEIEPEMLEAEDMIIEPEIEHIEIVDEKKPEDIKQEKETPKSTVEKKPEGDKPDKETPREPEFTPTIEIDFERAKPIKDHTKPSTPVSESSPDSKIEEDKKIPGPAFINFNEEDSKKEKKKKRFKFFFMLLIPIMAVAAGYYLVYYLSPNSQPTAHNNRDQSKLPIKKDSEKISNHQLIEEPYELLIPGTNEKASSIDIPGANESMTPTHSEASKMQNTDSSVLSNSSLPKQKEEKKIKTIGKKTIPVKPEQAKSKAKNEITSPKPKEKKPVEKKTNQSRNTHNQATPQENPSLNQSQKEEISENNSETEPIASSEPVVKEKELPPPVFTPPKKTYSEKSIVAASELDSKPQAIMTPLPRIQKRTRRAMKADQHLLVTILIDHQGKVEKVKLLKKSDSAEINTLVISSIAKWTYTPATKENIRVKTWKQIPITIKKNKE